MLTSLAISLFLGFFTLIEPSLLSTKVKTSDTVYSEDIVLIFSSLKPSYKPGETASFTLDVLNVREFPFSRIDFLINVKASSYLDLNIYSIESYSTRLFIPGKFERLCKAPSNDTIEVDIPKVIPPGLYTLELLAKISISKNPIKASITFFVEPSTYMIDYALKHLIFSSAIYILLTSGAYVNPKKLSRKQNPVLIKLTLFLYRVYAKSNIIDKMLKNSFGKFSIGQKFIFLGICAIIMTSYTLMTEIEMYFKEFSVLAYLLLAIGMVNLLLERLERIRKIINSKPYHSLRLIFSLTVLGLLIYTSNMILGAIIIGFTLYIVMRIILARAS